MGGRPKVSIVIPVYNRAELISKAIESVIAQTITDYELIIVDDGSTDDTKSVVNGYDTGKIRYVYQENKGKSSARNLGIGLAHGEYIAFLDSDDMFLPNKLALQVAVLDNNCDCGFVYSHAKNIDEAGNFLDHHFEGDLSGWIYPAMLFISNNCIATPTVMLRAKILEELGGFDETMHVCEDLDLWRRIARRYRVMQIHEPLSLVRIRTAEKIDVLEYMGARTRYYIKALEEDPELSNIKSELFSEMYKIYYDCAMHYNQKKIAIFILVKAMFNNPVDLINMLKKNL